MVSGGSSNFDRGPSPVKGMKVLALKHFPEQQEISTTPAAVLPNHRTVSEVASKNQSPDERKEIVLEMLVFADDQAVAIPEKWCFPKVSWP